MFKVTIPGFVYSKLNGHQGKACDSAFLSFTHCARCKISIREINPEELGSIGHAMLCQRLSELVGDL